MERIPTRRHLSSGRDRLERVNLETYRDERGDTNTPFEDDYAERRWDYPNNIASPPVVGQSLYGNSPGQPLLLEYPPHSLSLYTMTPEWDSSGTCPLPSHSRSLYKSQQRGVNAHGHQFTNQPQRRQSSANRGQRTDGANSASLSVLAREERPQMSTMSHRKGWSCSHSTVPQTDRSRHDRYHSKKPKSDKARCNRSHSPSMASYGLEPIYESDSKPKSKIYPKWARKLLRRPRMDAGARDARTKSPEHSESSSDLTPHEDSEAEVDDGPFNPSRDVIDPWLDGYTHRRISWSRFGGQDGRPVEAYLKMLLSHYAMKNMGGIRNNGTIYAVRPSEGKVTRKICLGVLSCRERGCKYTVHPRTEIPQTLYITSPAARGDCPNHDEPTCLSFIGCDVVQVISAFSGGVILLQNTSYEHD